MTQNPKDLEVFNEAKELADEVIKILFSSRTPRRFEDQMFGSITSIPANLAEFCSFTQDGSKLEKLQRCIAESNEVDYWLDVWKSHFSLPEDKYQSFQKRNTIVRKKIFKLKQHIFNIKQRK